MAVARDPSLPLEKRFPLFDEALRRTRFTGYARCLLMALEKAFGETDLTLDSYYSFYRDARIVARLADINTLMPDVLAGTHTLLDGQRHVSPLAPLHRLACRADVENLELLTSRTIHTLDDYLDACRTIFDHYRSLGAVCFKDNSAYIRSLAYKNPPRADAETVFNRILSEPFYHAPFDPHHNPLSDFLFRRFIRTAAEFDLPVQLHTGHMAGNSGDVTKANAALLRPLIEENPDVRFDLFHGNWPYSGDLLFLVKNFPNCFMDLCWGHIVDPLYTRDLLAHAVSCVPHAKIHAFGSDVGGGEPDFAWAHCEIAKDNVAASLASLIDNGYISTDDAESIAADIFFHNPNRFFRLGLDFDSLAK